MSAARRKFARDLADLSADDFESLVHRLIELEWPGAEKLDSPDGGADTIVADATGGLPRVFQVKHYADRITTAHWRKCEGSLDTAMRDHGPGQVTFVFPRNLTNAMREQFGTRLVGRHPDVVIDWWGLDSLSARLESAPWIVESFFGPEAAPLADQLLRVAEKGLKIRSVADVTSRQQDVVGYLDGRDERFQHQQLSGARSLPAPQWDPKPYVVVGTQGPGLPEARIAAWPRSGVEAPLPAISFSKDAAGAAALATARRELSAGRPVVLRDGLLVQLVAPQVLTDALAEMPDLEMESMELQPGQPVDIVLSVEDGEKTLLRQGQIRGVPPRADAPPGCTALMGLLGALEVEVEFPSSATPEGGAIAVTVRIRFSSNARDNLEALDVTDAWERAGRLRVDLPSGPPLEVECGPVGDDGLRDQWRELFRAIVALEQTTGLELPVPDEMSRSEILMLLQIEALLGGRAILVETDAAEPEIFGRTFALGRGRGPLRATTLGVTFDFTDVEWEARSVERPASGSAGVLVVVRGVLARNRGAWRVDSAVPRGPTSRD